MKRILSAAVKFETLATANAGEIERLLGDLAEVNPADADEALLMDGIASMQRLATELLADYEPINEQLRELLLLYTFDLFLSTLYRCYVEGVPDTGPKSFQEFCRADRWSQWGSSREERVRQTTHSIFALLVMMVTPAVSVGGDRILSAGVLYSIFADAFGLPLDVTPIEASELSECYARSETDPSAVERAANVVVRAMARNSQFLGHGEGQFHVPGVRGLSSDLSVRYLKTLAFYALVMRLGRLRKAEPEFVESLLEGFRQLGTEAA